MTGLAVYKTASKEQLWRPYVAWDFGLEMRVDQFDFSLPAHLIADRPAMPRDSARLLHVSSDQIADRSVGDLPQILQHGDVLVLNDTRVVPVRLHGSRGEIDVELLIHQQADDGTCLALAKPAKRLKPGDHVTFPEDLTADVLGRAADGSIHLRFNLTGQAFVDALERTGRIPLPPYMHRGDDEQDRTDYQTVYARNNGAIAAPTAGLHFTPELMKRLEDQSISLVYVTLHVGLGTFIPVKADDTDDHVMHQEWGELTKDVAAVLNSAKRDQRRIVAVGTTSLRLLESAVDDSGVVQPFAGLTDLFIVPGYQFKVVDALMTNFHLPKSTLFMLVSAFAGLETMQKAYAHAIANEYRFYSYGDACLLERSGKL